MLGEDPELLEAIVYNDDNLTRAMAILAENEAALRALARELMIRRSLDGEEIEWG